MNESNMIEYTAERCLLGDQSKSVDGGGQKLHPDIAKVSVRIDDGTSMPIVVLHLKTGQSAEAQVMPHNVNRPKDREMRPSDVERAVWEAMLQANANLSTATLQPPPVHIEHNLAWWQDQQARKLAHDTGS